MPLVYAGGQWLRLTRAECENYNVDPDEGLEPENDPDPRCNECGEWGLGCRCGDDEEAE